MKEIDYFREKMEDSIRSHNQSPLYEFDCGFYDNKEKPVDFLYEERFQRIIEADNINRMKNLVSLNLSDSEILVLSCFMGFYSKYFRDDFYVNCEVPEVIVEMRNILNEIIKKAPKHNSGALYRFLNEYDKCDFATGDILTVTHSLTTTTEHWDKNVNNYVITPLPAHQTLAHDLYRIYNHGEENQVNFLENTSFVINRVINSNGIRSIYMKEIDGTTCR